MNHRITLQLPTAYTTADDQSPDGSMTYLVEDRTADQGILDESIKAYKGV